MKYVITVELNDGNGYKYATGGYVSTSEIEKNINNSTMGLVARRISSPLGSPTSREGRGAQVI